MSDPWGGLTAHDLWEDLGSAGSSTLQDGSHNPNEIVGWGSASASAWTQTKPEKSEGDDKAGQPGGKQGGDQQQMQQPQYSTGYTTGYTGYMPQTGGYTTGYSAPSYGYSASPYDQSSMYSGGYSTGYSAPQYSTGYSTGYSAPQPGYSTGYSTGYSAPQQPSYSTGYSDPNSGYSSAGFGYQAPSTGYGDPSYSTGYSDPSGGTSMGQQPGGQMPMGAPGGQQPMGAPGGQMGAPGGKQPLPGQSSQQGGMGGMAGGQSAVNGKCPLPHRHRKPWNLMTLEQKDMFIDGFQQVRKNGKLDVFAQTHAQHDIQDYVHYTSLFTFYHAYLVWELETAIRDLGGKFACFTMPYYDWTLDAGLEHDPTILKSGIGGDGDPENGLCVKNDDSGFTWQTCKDYSAWRTIESVDSAEGDEVEGSMDGADDVDGSEDGEDTEGAPKAIRNDDGSFIYSNYDDDDIFKAQYISYGGAYDQFDPKDDDDPNWERDPDEKMEENDEIESEDEEITTDDLEDEELNADELEAEEVEEQCFWTQANCRGNEDAPFCCLKRKKSTTTLLPTAAEI